MSESVKYPKFSIVTVVYNGALEIEKTLKSCLEQDYAYKEYIVVDGVSTDKTLEIIDKYQNKISSIIIEPDQGIYDAMNKAIKVATGDWILFMNSGDSFYDLCVLSRIADALKDRKIEPDVIYGNTLYKYKNIFLKTMPMPLEKIEREMVFCHQSSLVRIDLIKSTLFDLRYKLAADYEMMLKFYTQNRKFIYLDIYISVFNQVDGTTLRNYVESAKEKFSVYKDYGSINNVFMLYKYILRMGLGLFVKRIIPAKLNDSIFLRKYKDRLVSLKEDSE